jgi:8-oxo-dGTP diphosphatase
VKVVRAAGGLVMRRDADGRAEVVVVHRPAYDDWSFPKGKLAGVESEGVAALREVEEETGLRCRLGQDLGTVGYRDRKGRPKIVRYWEMEAEDGDLAVPESEVDEVRWVSVESAGSLLSYEHDRDLLQRLEVRT